MILYVEGTPPRVSSIADTAISNSAGEAIFNLNYMHKAGQAGVAVLNISANKNIPGGSPLEGSGIIKMVEKPRTMRRYLFKNNAQINLQMKSDLSVGRFFISYPFRNVSPKIEQKDLL